MKTLLIFLIICKISIFEKQAIAEDIKDCMNGALQFSQIKGTAGNYDEVIARGNQFVTLQYDKLTIFDNFKPVLQKALSISKKRLNLDLFQNILFTDKTRLGIYVPENDELLWKDSPYRYPIENQVFDNNNTIYAIINGRIFYAKTTDKYFQTLTRLERFQNVAHLVRGDGSHIYFTYESLKTSWIVNATTEQTIMQTTIFKTLNYVWGNYCGNGYLSLVDKNCTLKISRVFSSFNVHHPNLNKTMDFQDCDYTRDAKFIFSYEGQGDKTYFFNKNKIYRILISNYNNQLCVGAKLNNITINAAAINSNYIMLATSNGLWSAMW